jgi:thiamine biosynthesis protein ThiI
MLALIMVRYGEIALKGKNRGEFEKQLQRNLYGAVKALGGSVERMHGRFMVKGPLENLEGMLNSLQKTFGVISVSPVMQTSLAMEKIKDTALAAVDKIAPAQSSSFKISARRANKNFPCQSPEICRLLGAHILKHHPSLKVNLGNPDLEISVEIGYQHAYIYLEQLRGPGGLPVGITGRSLLLLSGGIDSPAAGWLSMKRGLRIEALHFHSFPFTGKRSLEKAATLCRKLSHYGGKIVLHTINVAEIQKELRSNCAGELSVILLRRFMLRLAERLSAERRLQALITGDNLGQVASQTLESINVISQSTKMLILRPLIGFDKLEIIKIAQDIDTYETSILPYEDCCTLFVPKNPATRPKLPVVEREEDRLNMERLLDQAYSTLISEAINRQ